ncbi:cysteine hydrolase [Candidatus Woesearchaeota archaeon]|nr:cysteine hydrolase [Candidatus Woesearchaeota archaeon]
MAGLEEKLAGTLFWNVDTAGDFMRKDGRLYVPGAEEIEPALERVTKTAEDYDVPVINQADSHQKGSGELSDNPDFVKTFPDHCMYGTSGAEFVPATKPRDAYVLDWRDRTLDEKMVLSHRNIVLTKDHVDVFNREHGSPHVERVLEILKPERVFVYGVATNVCVDFAVGGLLDRKIGGRPIEVYVVRDAIKGLPGIPDPTDAWVARGVRMIDSTALEQYLR